MQLPEFEKDKLPQEVQDYIGDGELEIEVLNDIKDDYQPQITPEKNAYLDRKLLKSMDELVALQKIQNKKLTKKEKWKEIKKVSRYFKSPLYEIKNLDKSTEA
jgi:hypothetical protein